PAGSVRGMVLVRRRAASARPLPFAARVVAGLACAATVVVGGGSAATASSCGAEEAPSGSSPAAHAYVEAINAGTPAWQAVGEAIAEQGLRMHPEDLQAQVAADAPFLRTVRSIDYPAEALPAARTFVVAVRKYDRYMAEVAASGTFPESFTEVDALLNDQRSAASASLRASLGL